MKTRRQSRRRMSTLFRMEKQQQAEVKSAEEEQMDDGDESWQERPEMWVPKELIRPQWFHDTTNDLERVQRRVRAEKIVEAIQGWSMPEVLVPRNRPTMVKQILPAVLKQETHVKQEVVSPPILNSKLMSTRAKTAAAAVAATISAGGAAKSKLEKFLAPTTTKTINEENKLRIDASKRHHLDLNKLPFPIITPGTSGGGLSVQEMVQRMADQGQLVLENGQLVFRTQDKSRKPQQQTCRTKSNEFNLNVNLLDPKDEEEEEEYPIITKVESMSSPESKAEGVGNSSTMSDGGVTFYFNEDEENVLDNNEETSDSQLYLVDEDGFKKPTLLSKVSPVSLLKSSRKQRMKRVDPSSVVPVSVTNSTASSASESDVDLTEFPTDEDESESEFQNTNTVWVVPRQASSRSPSPNEVPEFELDEPEFILTTGSLDEIAPPKKRKQKHEPQPHTDGKIYPKPAFSYSCLIAMSLKNSKTGSLPVSEIYKFMCDHFPYFKSAPSGWKNSVRHNLSLNKCFEKIEKPGNGARKGCLWALNPAKIHKMDEEVQKWLRKDPLAIRRAMSDPENLELIERGELKRDYSGNGASDEDDEEDISEPCTPLTQAQLLARRSRGNSSDSMGDTTMSSTTPTTTVSQVQAITLSRPIEQKIHVKSEPMDTLDFGTITNVQGNYLCHTGAGTGTYTLSFSTMNNATTPIIIRRTPVK